MLLPLRRVSGCLRRSLSTAAPRPTWAMINRIATAGESAQRASLLFSTPPLASRISIPKQAFNLDAAHPAKDGINILGSGVLATSGDGFLLLNIFKTRVRAHPLLKLDLPIEVLHKTAPFETIYKEFVCFVCNPVTGQLFRLPDFDGTEKTLTGHHLGLLTQADGDHGPPKRYAVAQLNQVDGERRFVFRRFSSETGEWKKLVLPSPFPSPREMDMNHEVLAFRGRLWWVDVSWGAISVDPFSARPELRHVELPGHSMLTRQVDEAGMRELVKHRRMGVSDGRLCYAEVSSEEPFCIKYFTLDDESGCWTLEHQVSAATLRANGGHATASEMPLIAVIDPLNTDVLHLTVGRVIVSADMRSKWVVEYCSLDSAVRPSKSSSSFLLPCVLPSFLGSSSIPGKEDVVENKTLADVLVRSNRYQEK